MPSNPSHPGLLPLLRDWLSIGVQSFGGGSVTRYLIYQATVDRRRWVSDDEFTRYWAICQMTPGINLLALTTLIGWRLRGPLGVAVCLFGLLFPSVTVTLLVTAVYATIQGLPLVQAALKGIVPATVGLGLIMSWKLAEPILVTARREGRGSFVAYALILALCIVLAAVTHLPVMLLLVLGGALGALYHWRAEGGRQKAGAQGSGGAGEPGEAGEVGR